MIIRQTYNSYQIECETTAHSEYQAAREITALDMSFNELVQVIGLDDSTIKIITQ
jgi:hypothetical protein